ncbi:DnaD domain protein [Shouchella shacheensis]|uniref:DnaD domain protein n=1 Tax=Shouchella shacheensis TaxID=1649580 RepID=UPI0007401AF9|nr:DnaD domain protein [Shouchella shacheensis]
MNYIAEINAYYIWQETNPCSTGATALWHSLMNVCNRTGWKPSFTVSSSILLGKTGLSKSQLFRARKELIHKGYIEVAHRPGKAAVYQMQSLLVAYESAKSYQDHSLEYPPHKPIERPDTPHLDRSSHQPLSDRSHEELNDFSLEDSQEVAYIDVQQDTQQGKEQGMQQDVKQDLHQGVQPLVKQNHTTPNPTKAAAAGVSEVLRYCEEQAFEPLSSRSQRAIEEWCSGRAFDSPKEVVMEAIHRSVENGAPRWRYASSLLWDWREKGARQLADVHALDPARGSFSRPRLKGGEHIAGTAFLIPDSKLGF